MLGNETSMLRQGFVQLIMYVKEKHLSKAFKGLDSKFMRYLNNIYLREFTAVKYSVLDCGRQLFSENGDGFTSAKVSLKKNLSCS